MAEEKEAFLTRWSRLKRDSAAEPARIPERKDGEKPVPPIESVTPASDFTVFMQPKVNDELRRSALKKLFSDPHFNVPDPFEPYSRDWNIADPIPADLLARLNQARTVLLTPEERKALEEQEQAKAAETKDAIDAKETPADEPGSQDA